MKRDLITLAGRLVVKCRKGGIKVVVAESCTGGMVAAAITSIPGSSDIFDRAFITYSNEAKTEMLGVPASLIKKHGAVSAEVAKAMASGALKNSHADRAVSITGIAGPGGGTKIKPVGLVYIGIAKKKGAAKVYEYNFSGSRDMVRSQAVKSAFEMLFR